MTAHTLYRHYDADDRLLYVGITVNYAERCRTHKCRSDWWPRVARSTQITGLTADEAALLERHAIVTERPPHNKRAGGGGRPPVIGFPGLAPDLSTLNGRMSAVILAYLRREGMTRAEFSERSGITVPTLTRRLRGQRVWNVNDTLRVAQAMGIEHSHLYHQAEELEAEGCAA